MKIFLVNFGFLSGVIGFALYLFIIVSGFAECCASVSTKTFNIIALTALAVSVIIFGICMYHNCCKYLKKQK